MYTFTEDSVDNKNLRIYTLIRLLKIITYEMLI